MGVLDAYPWIPERFSFICTEQNGAYAVCDCPIKCHKVARVRLSVGTDGRLLLKCMRECPTLEMLRAVGLGWKDCWPDGRMPDRPKQEIVARYPYHDETGDVVLYQTIRLEPGRHGRDKEFRQRQPLRPHGWTWSLDGVRRVLYRLPEIIRSAAAEVPVIVVAGEKDADNLRALGLIATTNVCGERAEWLDSYSESLAGRDVTVVEDRDAAGRRHAHEVCGSLMRYARTVRRVVLPEKDATAYLVALRRLDITTPAELRDTFLATLDMEPRWAAID